MRGLLLDEFKGAGAAYDAQACALAARALGLGELGLDVVAVILALMGEDSTGVFSGAYQAIG
jgi:hypothetical protein